jgi:hypothetical protein
LVVLGGAIAGADFQGGPQRIPSGGPFSFPTQVLNFGGSIVTNLGGTSFTFTKAGIYQLNFTGEFSFNAGGANAAFIQILLNGIPSPIVWFWASSEFTGNRLISVQAGDTLSLVPNGLVVVPNGYACELVILQVQ